SRFRLRLGGSERRLEILGGGEGSSGLLGLGKHVVAEDAVSRGARPCTRHGGELALRLARRPLDGGEALACLGEHALRFAPELAQAVFLGARGRSGLHTLALR